MMWKHSLVIFQYMKSGYIQREVKNTVEIMLRRQPFKKPPLHFDNSLAWFSYFGTTES